MATQPMVGCRVPVEWKEKLEEIANESGRNTAQVVHEAIRQYLETIEEVSFNTKIHEVLQLPGVLETNPLISSLSQRIEAFETKLSSIQKLLTTLDVSLEETSPSKAVLTSEELALILGVTPRAVNAAASKGKEHFMNWTQRFRKGGKWTFEIINPGMKKLDRRFIPL
ncbi:ribbon-helix-helix domain-containing protein [Leptolyngbya sp. DQ-M1]|uniref:ribbon-helix-helix protein, CopG family n=1 Tax=Leptolyngbya sp. DQ-M1 TaxID=2933920 RepID=UPI0032994C90